MAITWITPVEVTPGSASAWTDVDVSAYIPAGATGVMCEFVNNADSGAYDCGLRKNGSTDARTNGSNGLVMQGGFTGVDGSRIFEAYVGSTTVIDLYLVGYFTDEAVFFTNGVSKTLGNSAWVDIDISSDTGADTAIAAIFDHQYSSDYDWGFRKNGSGDNRINKVYYHSWPIIGVDGSEICEGYGHWTATATYLIGYIKSGATFNTNATNLSLASTGSWADLPSALPANSIGGFFEVVGDVGGDYYYYGIRENASARNIKGKNMNHAFYTSKCDGSQICDGYIDNTMIDFFLVGYVTAGGISIPVAMAENRQRIN